MTRTTARGGRSLRHLLAAAIVGGLGLTGCGQKPAGDAGPPSADEAAPAANAAAPDKPSTQPGAAAPRDRWHQAFADAVRTGEDPPAQAPKPADVTDAGLPASKVLDEVARLWDTIRFTSPAGKKVDYAATLETDSGTIRLALFPDVAPNHVRNFVALARAGYYDKLFFDGVRHEEGEGGIFRALEGGSPAPKGEPDNDSIGYWLKPEFNPESPVAHEEGVVGACRRSEDDSAACRFYISLSKAPALDGKMTIFGKVVQGIDVVRTIYSQGAILDEEHDGRRRPERPVMIRKVTIQTSER
jgi:peptidyl-prolyl cis-trans isomerase B (cyclophilin B)